MLLVVVCVALLSAGLAWMGLRVWYRPDTGAPQWHATPLSAEAAQLNYKREDGYRTDMSRSAEALQSLLNGPGGSQLLWENAETGNRGITWNSREDRRGCREMERRSVINGTFRDEVATVCRNARAQWPAEIAWSPR